MTLKYNREDNPKWGGFLAYEGLFPGAFGICHLRIIPGKKKTVFLASELANNPGPSIANCPEAVWLSIFPSDRSEESSSERTLLIEHFNDKAILGCGSNHYNLVQIDPEDNVRRSRLSREEIVELAGVSATDLDVDENLLCVDPLKFRVR